MRRTTGATGRAGETRAPRLIPPGPIARWTGGSGLETAAAAGLAEVDVEPTVGDGAGARAQHAITGVAAAPGQHGIDDSRSHGSE